MSSNMPDLTGKTCVAKLRRNESTGFRPRYPTCGKPATELNDAGEPCCTAHGDRARRRREQRAKDVEQAKRDKVAARRKLVLAKLELADAVMGLGEIGPEPINRIGQAEHAVTVALAEWAKHDGNGVEPPWHDHEMRWPIGATE